MLDVNPDEAARIEAAIDECIDAMKIANAQMANDPTEIERLKAETPTMLTELRAAYVIVQV